MCFAFRSGQCSSDRGFGFFEKGHRTPGRSAPSQPGEARTLLETLNPPLPPQEGRELGTRGHAEGRPGPVAATALTFEVPRGLFFFAGLSRSTGRRDASDREEAQTRRAKKKEKAPRAAAPRRLRQSLSRPEAGKLRRTGARETDDARRAPRGPWGPLSFPGGDNNNDSSSFSAFA